MEKVFIAHKTKKGKTQTVAEHLFETAEMSEQFSSKIGMPKMGYLVGLLHDFGKYSDEFYKRIMEDGEKCDHSTAGAQYLSSIFKNTSLNTQKCWVPILELLILSHHGGLLDEITPSGETPRLARLEKEVYLTKDIKNADLKVLKQVEELAKYNFDKEFIPIFQKIKETNSTDKTALFTLSLLTKFLFSCLIDADRKSTIKFENTEEKLSE